MEVAMEKTVCELFAGVGGFRLGLERASSEQKTVWFSQYEPSMKKQQAHECQVKHFGDVDEFTGIDIAAVDKNHIPEHNLLVGGFPCQDYSVARPLTGSTGLEGKKVFCGGRSEMCSLQNIHLLFCLKMWIGF